jgi:hypothetical protein
VRLRRLRDDPDGSRVPTRRDLVIFAGYCACAGVYIAVGVVATDVLLSYWVAVAYFIAAGWGVPTVVRRLLR